MGGEVSLPPDTRSAFFSGSCVASLQHCRKGAKVRLERSCDGKILVFDLFCPHGRRLRKGNRLGYNEFIMVDTGMALSLVPLLLDKELL